MRKKRGELESDGLDVSDVDGDENGSIGGRLEK